MGNTPRLDASGAAMWALVETYVGARRLQAQTYGRDCAAIGLLKAISRKVRVGLQGGFGARVRDWPHG
jgi:hypothetical protein